MYRALYRKWRPMRFEDVVGQQAIVTALQNQITAGRVGHAYMFTGTRGTGKTTCAKIFAKAVNCPHAEHGDPCGQCEVCRGIDNGSILDVVEIDAASNNGVDNIRDLRDETAYTPSVCQYKVYIIDEVHMLSIAAFNALLKIMEEPPSHVIFILATTEIHKVPATILSRCQRYDFGRIRPEDIAARIQYIAEQEQIQLDPGAAALIARLADGALRDALSILDTCAGVSQQVDEELVRRMAGVTDKSYLFRLSDALGSGDAVSALEELAELRQRSVDVKRLCEELVGHYRNLMLAGLPGGQGLLTGVAPEEEQLYLEKAQQVPQGFAVRAIKLLGGAMEKMNRGTDQRIELELAMFAITEPPVSPAVQVIQQVQAAAPTTQQGFASAPLRASNAPLRQQPFQQNSNVPLQQAQPPAQQETPHQPVQVPDEPPVQADPEDLPPWEVEKAKTPEKVPEEIRTSPEPLPEPEEPAEKTDSYVPEEPPIQDDPDELPPWEREPVEMKEVPKPQIKQPQQPFRQSNPGTVEPFAPWKQVVAALEGKEAMLYAFLKESKAYYDGRRVLIDGGDFFRDYIRTNKEGQHLLKAIIEDVTGVHCGIGPYTPPGEAQEVNQPTLEQTLLEMQSKGVEVLDIADE